jgi:hypothetical protein
MVTDDNKAIVRAAFDVFMSDDQSALDDLLAPGCVLHQCGFLEPIRGAEAIKQRRAGQFVSERTVHLEEIVRQCVSPGQARPADFVWVYVVPASRR